MKKLLSIILSATIMISPIGTSCFAHDNSSILEETSLNEKDIESALTILDDNLEKNELVKNTLHKIVEESSEAKNDNGETLINNIKNEIDNNEDFRKESQNVLVNTFNELDKNEKFKEFKIKLKNKIENDEDFREDFKKMTETLEDDTQATAAVFLLFVFIFTISGTVISLANLDKFIGWILTFLLAGGSFLTLKLISCIACYEPNKTKLLKDLGLPMSEIKKFYQSFRGNEEFEYTLNKIISESDANNDVFGKEFEKNLNEKIESSESFKAQFNKEFKRKIKNISKELVEIKEVNKSKNDKKPKERVSFKWKLFKMILGWLIGFYEGRNAAFFLSFPIHYLNNIYNLFKESFIGAYENAKIEYDEAQRYLYKERPSFKSILKAAKEGFCQSYNNFDESKLPDEEKINKAIKPILIVVMGLYEAFTF